ncbi:MAG: hypothetical protein ACREBE_23850, partial [bacterium]
SILCIPVRASSGDVIAVAQLLNRSDGKPFDEQDETRFVEFMRSIGVILEGFAKVESGRGKGSALT